MTLHSMWPPSMLLPLSFWFLDLDSQLLGLGGRTPAAAAAAATGVSAVFSVRTSHYSPSLSISAAGPCVIASGAPGSTSAAPPAAVIAASALALPICPSSAPFSRLLLLPLLPLPPSPLVLAAAFPPPPPHPKTPPHLPFRRRTPLLLL